MQWCLAGRDKGRCDGTFQKLRLAQPGDRSVLPFSSLFLSGSRTVGRFQMTLQVIFKNLWLSHFPDMFSVTNPGCKITDAKLTAKLKLV